MLQCHSAQWPGITTLTVDLEDEHEATSSNTKESIGSVVGQLTRLLPSLTNLYFANYHENNDARAVCRALAANYSPQIHRLQFHHALTFDAHQQFSKTLTHLDIALSLSSSPPRIYAEPLRYLRLQNVPLNFDWALCFGSTSDGHVDFDHLETLDVGFQFEPSSVAATEKNRDTCELRFFRLRQLSVSGCLERCSLLERARFLLPLRAVSIRGAASAMRVLSQIAAPKIKCIKLDVDTAGNAPGVQPIADLNRALKAVRGESSIDLFVRQHSVHLDLHMFECPNLTRIAITAPTSPMQLMVLIGKYPRLEYLALHNLVVDYVPTQASMVRPGRYIGEYLEPADACIKHLYLKHSTAYDTVKKASVLVSFIMLLLPSLETLATIVDTIQEISGVLCDYKPFYPHLQNIELRNANAHYFKP
ncbi:hypothetical protein LPJ70_001039 [Coemansia sp. RSA 2708]|nr:hypothetical protein LPJ70_001039 [Coemansia sp. RSA 2708]